MSYNARREVVDQCAIVLKNSREEAQLFRAAASWQRLS
jgi:hypothetical protein